MTDIHLVRKERQRGHRVQAVDKLVDLIARHWEIAEAAGSKDLRVTGGVVIVSPLHQPAGFNALELGPGIIEN